MTSFDLVILLLLLVAAVIGARAGFLGPVLGLIGAAAGFGAALLLASAAQPALEQVEQPGRALMAIVGVTFLVLAGEATGAGIGSTISRRAAGAWMEPIDVIGGAVVGIAHGLLLVWLLGGVLAAGLAPGVARAAQGSVVLETVYQRTPAASEVAGELVALFEATALPRLFHGLEPPPAPPVDLPDDAQTRELAESGIPSTLRVEGTGCALRVQVGSGFFVSPTQAVTNAHVVAGSTAQSVSVGGRTFAATVVLFDTDADLALLDIPAAEGTPLELATETPERGQPAVAIGFPGGGGMTVTPAAVTASHTVTGPDIYGQGHVQRSIVEMRAQISQGNSGGPLVTAPGVAGGVVFGGSRTDAGVGYAISAPSAAERIGPALGRTAAVDTGPCR